MFISRADELYGSSLDRHDRHQIAFRLTSDKKSAETLSFPLLRAGLGDLLCQAERRTYASKTSEKMRPESAAEANVVRRSQQPDRLLNQ